VARTWCAHCHAVERGETRQRADGLPSFTTLANDSRHTPERLRAFLTRPHGRMPDLNLSRQDRDDLIAYMLSLREGRATPSTEPSPRRP
jgi:mono/diheme cytochrome c family protein